uniref:Sialate O-acetylesterase domain-containing protein n=1 Tax=viral metagenome TaxID=1070528 RepID=A0A6C0F692_9ZZZZ|tara:strand:- start:2127 stop:3617 length:1491 start_codon:yes stop_codon:yes gene_type:complete
MNFEVKEKVYLVYEFDIMNKDVKYKINNSAKVPKGYFHRVGYYMQLQHYIYGNQWVYTEFDAFTDDVRKIGIPEANGKEWVFAKDINNLVVKSSDGALVNKCKKSGRMIFSAYNYNEIDDIYKCIGDYGTMQLSSNEGVIWAYNNINNDICDIGIGTNINEKMYRRDWTFAQNGDEYSIKHMKVYIIYNEVGHHNEIKELDICRINLSGIAHGDKLRYNERTKDWGITQIEYRKNKEMKNLPNFIIVLSGQSNSQGWNAEVEECNWQDKLHERIFGYNVDELRWEIADLKTQSLGSSWYRKPGWQSLAFHMARRLVEAYVDIRPGIINLGIGGQSICRWVKYEQGDLWYKFNCERAFAVGVCQGDVFDMHSKYINDALNLCEGKCRVDVICWHQGESDSDLLGGNSEYYKESLQRVVEQYRSIIWCNEDTPFIVGETTSEDRNIELREVAATNNKMKCVKIADLTRQKEDRIHFDCKAQRKLGTRYFKALRSLYDD